MSLLTVHERSTSGDFSVTLWKLHMFDINPAV